MYKSSWKLIAQRWRTVENSVQKLSIVQEVTKKHLAEIPKDNESSNPLDYLNAPFDPDEDFDIP